MDLRKLCRRTPLTEEPRSGGGWPQVRIQEFRGTVKTLQTLLCCNSQGVTTAQIWSPVSPPSSSLFLPLPLPLSLAFPLFFCDIPLPERAASLSRSSERICHVKGWILSVAGADRDGPRRDPGLRRRPKQINTAKRRGRREQHRRMKRRLRAIFQ